MATRERVGPNLIVHLFVFLFASFFFGKLYICLSPCLVRKRAEELLRKRKERQEGKEREEEEKNKKAGLCLSNPLCRAVTTAIPGPSMYRSGFGCRLGLLTRLLWLRTAIAQRARKLQVAVAIARQSVNNKEASNACVNERCKILRSLNRVFVFEIVLCIGALSKDPARFVDLGFWILRNKEAQEYKSSSQETNHNKR